MRHPWKACQTAGQFNTTFHETSYGNVIKRAFNAWHSGYWIEHLTSNWLVVSSSPSKVPFPLFPLSVKLHPHQCFLPLVASRNAFERDLH